MKISSKINIFVVLLSLFILFQGICLLLGVSFFNLSLKQMLFNLLSILVFSLLISIFYSLTNKLNKSHTIKDLFVKHQGFITVIYLLCCAVIASLFAVISNILSILKLFSLIIDDLNIGILTLTISAYIIAAYLMLYIEASIRFKNSLICKLLLIPHKMKLL